MTKILPLLLLPSPGGEAENFRLPIGHPLLGKAVFAHALAALEAAAGACTLVPEEGNGKTDFFPGESTWAHCFRDAAAQGGAQKVLTRSFSIARRSLPARKWPSES